MVQKFSQAPFMLTLAGAQKGDPRISAFPPNSLMFFLRLKPPNCWHTAPFLTINCPKCYCFRYLCKMKKKEIEKIQSRLIHFMVSWVSKGQLILKYVGVIVYHLLRDFFDLTPFQRLGQKSLKRFRWYFGRNDDTKRTY